MATMLCMQTTDTSIELNWHDGMLRSRQHADRPPLGSGYQRVRPVPPHRPVVPVGAPGELRLDARKADVIPEYPY